jgi:hypothetical protein
MDNITSGDVHNSCLCVSLCFYLFTQLDLVVIGLGLLLKLWRSVDVCIVRTELFK